MTGTDFEMRSIAAVLRRQSRVMLATAGACFALAVGYLIAVTPTYTATALIIVDPAQKNLLDNSPAIGGSVSSDNARLDSEVEILRSDAIALALVNARNLMSDAEFGPHLSFTDKLTQAVGIAQAAVVPGDRLLGQTLNGLKKAITVRRRGLTYLISVSVDSTTPERAADLANTLSETYIRQQVDAKIAGSLSSKSVLEGEIDKARAALANSEDAFAAYLRANAPRIEAETGNGTVVRLANALSGLEAEITAKRGLKSESAALLLQQDWAGLTRKLGEQALLQLQQEQSQLAIKLGQTPDPVQKLDLGSQLAAVQARLDQRASGLVGAIDLDLAQLDRQAREARAAMQAAVSGIDLPAELLTDIYQIQQEAGLARVQYQSLLSRRQDLQMQARIQLADSRIVSPALVPVSPSNPNKAVVMLLASAAALGLGISSAFLREYFIGGITTAPQLAEVLQVPDAVTIPYIKETNTDTLSLSERVIDAPLSIYAESIRTLRASIDHRLREAGVRPDAAAGGQVILMTSALPGEGKTTTSLALARTYALAGKKTLLIDADMRIPSVHRHLGFEPDFGLLDYLRDARGSAVTGDFYARDPSTPLAVMLGARRSDLPTDQLVNSESFEALLDQARQVYDIVVIDSPPVLPVVDARYLARKADAVVMLVKWASTNQIDLRAAARPLQEAMPRTAVFLPVLGQKRGALVTGYSGRYGEYSPTI